MAVLLASASAFRPPTPCGLAGSAPARRAMRLARPAPARGALPLMQDDDFSQRTRLRAEIESPFAKVRLFVLPVLFLAAGIATYFAGTALLAEAVGAREAADDSLVNLGVDLAALAGIGFLWSREAKSAEARLRRIDRGAALASLRVTLLGGSGRSCKLGDLRRREGGGAESTSKRVVVVAAGEAALGESLAAAAASSAALVDADIVVIPLLLLPDAALPRIALPPPALVGADSEHLALPTALEQWRPVLRGELETARSQGADVALRGITLVLKKNGRVGVRRLGAPDWAGMVDDVDARSRAGLDTTNI